MSTVAEGIGVCAAEGAEAQSNAAAELSVCSNHTTVNDIGVGVGTGRGVVDVAGRARGAVGDGAQTPRSTSLGCQSTILDLLALLEPEVLDVVGLNRGNLESVNFGGPNLSSSRGNVNTSYLRVALDLLDCGLVEFTSVGVPLADVVGVLNTNGVTLGQATSVDIRDPGQVRVWLDVLLEGDDVLSRDHLRSTRSRRSQDGWEQSSEEDGEVAEAGHCGYSKRWVSRG